MLFTLLGVIGGFIPKLVALVVAVLEFHEVLRFVSLVLLSLVLGVEGQSPAVVDCRRSGGETRDEPLGRGEGRGAPHEIHVGRLQGLRWVLLVLPLVQVFLVNIFFQVVCPLQAEFC